MRQPISVAPGQEPRPSQYRKRNLRIAVRQLERAELYLVAVTDLDLDDEAAAGSLDDLIEHLRSLRRYLLGLKASA